MRRLLVLSILLLTGCATSMPEIRGLHARLRDQVHEAKLLGAMECAPTELAQAQVAWRMASLEIGEGDLARAGDHINEGLASTKAAIALGDRCPARGFDVADRSIDPWLDADGDAVADAADQCPWILEDLDGWEDGDGCPELDNDGDGLADAEDRCPDEAEDVDFYFDEDGCPEPDNDGDGFDDPVDDCPLDVEVVNGWEDEDGCPDVNGDLVSVGDERITFPKAIRFAKDSPKLMPQSLPALRELSMLLKRKGELKLRIEVHTDSRGEQIDLLSLSQSRALEVLEFLSGDGVPRGQLDAQGFGGEVPIETNRTEAGRAANRRVEIAILAGNPGN